MIADAGEMTWLFLHWPSPLEASEATGLLDRLARDAHRQPVIFETRSTEGVVSHRFGSPAHQVRAIADVVEAHIPWLTVSTSKEPLEPLQLTTQLKLTRPALSLLTDREPQATRAIFAALSAAHFRDEHAVLQVVVGHGTPSRLPAKGGADPTQPWWDVLTHGALPPSKEVASRMQSKDSEFNFKAVLRIGVSAQSEGRRTTLMRGLLAALRTIQAPGTRMELMRTRREDFEKLPRHGWLRLSVPEALCLLGWPIGSNPLPGMPDAHPKLLRLNATDIETTRVFGRTNAPGEAKPVGVAIKDALFHTHVIGPTGSGKSTLLLNLVVADLEAGRGIAVIDPKSDLIRDILERVPAHRRDDIVVLDPTQVQSVTGLNPLAVPGTSPELIADGIFGIFRDLFPAAFGPRVSDMAHASLSTLAQTPGAALTWLPRLLTDASFRRGLTDALDDKEGLGAFWDEFNEMTPRSQAQFIAPVLSRLRQFLLRPSLRRVLEQSTPRFTPDQIFTEKKVLLVPLNSGTLGNDASRLLGSLLVSQLWQLSLARTTLPKDQRHPTSIYIDEVQEYLRLGGNELNDALARSRSLGVAWHLAHQYRRQLSPAMLDAVDSNARNKIVYSPNIKDAKDVAAMAPELAAEDFVKLPPFAVYANLMRHGRQLGWISADTLSAPLARSDPIDLITRSQELYGGFDIQADAPRGEHAQYPAAGGNLSRQSKADAEMPTSRSTPSGAQIGRKKRGDS